jgi:excinuclease UvrABC helicase subunit UvrB
MAWSVQQLRPQLLMMHLRAKATLAIDAGEHQTAIDIVENGIEEIRSFFQGLDRPDLAESSGEIQSLKMWLTDLKATKPLSEKEKLEKELNEAIQREDYEKAAHFRDRLKQIK